jgi:hypothetical protein
MGQGDRTVLVDTADPAPRVYKVRGMTMFLTKEIIAMFSKKMKITLALGAVIACMSPMIANAQTPALIQEFNAWGAYSYQSANGKVCYVLSPHKTAAPLSEDGRTLSHGQNYLLVAQRVGQNVVYEPQVMMSYKLRQDSKVKVQVGDKNFQFISRGKVAHIENAAEGPAFVAALRAGSSATVQVVSSRNGNNRDYSFSLSGITAALKNISSCS